MLDIRTNIPNKKVKSELIVKKLLSIEEVTSAKTILVYYPTKSEVDISETFKILEEQGKTIFLPKVEDYKIANFSQKTYLSAGKNGILEPKGRVTINPRNIDVAIIPGIGFDSAGNRIGHGGGWYDRIIEEINFKYIIGVCFDSQILPIAPNEPHDKSVHLIITEKQIINTRY
ncbi:5-formyltetrahydrofolate cyclo-ligase [Candidatus Dojkabacteria bacterium]|uniref:5-formyltetrahydrofolate cyclo-ligase n=1 Tax=Candidatus Dojkabacteria bacterium TaxID=2099670 RepID=A0A955I8S2_9BACT|nr:5-formyltetrahydrofolate cyclo-ligase [Candidatus Dojkabacteria bacterium]